MSLKKDIFHPLDLIKRGLVIYNKHGFRLFLAHLKEYIFPPKSNKIKINNVSVNDNYFSFDENKKNQPTKLSHRKLSFNTKFNQSLNNYINNKTSFTICSKNYLHFALTLRESFLEKNPDWDFFIFIIDRIDNSYEAEIFRELNQIGIKFNFIHEIDFGTTYNISEMLLRYTVMEANTAFKPFIIKYLLQKGFNKVIYLDPDIYIYEPLNQIDSLLDKYEIVITPHITKIIRDDKNPSHSDLIKSGLFNLGFIAFRYGEESSKFVDWWSEMLFDKCFVDLENHLFVDQKWCDWIPVLTDNYYILKDPAFNVAYWNLQERNIESANDKYKINGNNLVFFHFSGIILNNLDKISIHQNRFKMNDFKFLRKIFEEYKQLIQNNHYDVFSKMSYHFDYIPGSNIKIDTTKRKQLTEYFISLKSENHFFTPLSSDGDKHVHTFIKEDDSAVDLEYFSNDSNFNDDLKFNHFGMNIYGYFSYNLGLGENSRLFVHKINQCGIPYLLQDVKIKGHPVETCYDNEKIMKFKCLKPFYNTNLILINADIIEHYNISDNKYNQYNYANWWWEFDDYLTYPAKSDYINEVIVYSDIIKSAVEKCKPANVKVRKLTFPFRETWGKLEDSSLVRKRYNIHHDDFVIFFNFDYKSSNERKNFEGCLRAVKAAFEEIKNVKLIVKTGGQQLFPELHKKNLNLISDLKLDNKTIILAKNFTKNEFMSIINASDCYLSMHRSEGLGLGMLEAMSIGKPTLGTAYSGNLEFMNEKNSLLIDYTMTEVKNDFGPYRKGWRWAEPSVEDAAEKLRKLYFDRDFAEKLGKIAEESVKNQFGNDFIYKNEYYDLMNL